MSTIHDVDTIFHDVAAGPKDVAKALALIVFWVAIVGAVVVPGVAFLALPPPAQTTVVRLNTHPVAVTPSAAIVVAPGPSND